MNWYFCLKYPLLLLDIAWNNSWLLLNSCTGLTLIGRLFAFYPKCYPNLTACHVNSTGRYAEIKRTSASRRDSWICPGLMQYWHWTLFVRSIRCESIPFNFSGIRFDHRTLGSVTYRKWALFREFYSYEGHLHLLDWTSPLTWSVRYLITYL